MTDIERVFALVGREIAFGKLRVYGMDFERLDSEAVIEVDRVHVGRASYGCHITVWSVEDAVVTWHAPDMDSVVKRCLEDVGDG